MNIALKRRSAIIGAAAITVAVVGGAAAVVARSDSSGSVAAATGAVDVVKVQRKDLAVYTTYSGTLGFGSPVTLMENGATTSDTSSGSAAASTPLASTAKGSSAPATTIGGTLTAAPTSGAVVSRGDVVYRVDDQPRVLLYGAIPAWRDLSAASSAGDDIAQLQENLIALGYDASNHMTVSGTFDSATLAAVDAWQSTLGVTVTGDVTLGSVFFLSGPVRVGTNKVDLGAAVRNGSAVTEVTPTEVDSSVVSPVVGTVADVPAAGTAITDGATLFTIDGTPVVAKVESSATTISTSTDGFTVTVPPESVVTLSAGDSGATAVSVHRPVLTVSWSQRIVTAALSVTDRAKVKVGDTVQVTLPDGTTRPGQINVIGAVASQAANSRSAPTVAVTVGVTDTGLDASLVSTPVTVGFASQTAKGVLAVPVTALVALQEGGYAVAVGDQAPGRLTAVQPGLYADSWVEVDGDGISEGQSVLVAR